MKKMKKRWEITNFIRLVITLTLVVALEMTLVSCGKEGIATGETAADGENLESVAASSESLSQETSPESLKSESDKKNGSSDSIPDITVSDKVLTFTALKVGAADAFVLRSADHVTVIDTATDKKADILVNFLNKQGITGIDELIITHFDKDHVGGADQIINSFDIGTIYTTYRSKDSDQIDEYDAAMKLHGLTENVVTSELSYQVGDVSYTIYPPQSPSYPDKESNNSSLVVKVTFGDNSILFAGDAESARLSELLANSDLSATILKVPHHGRYCDKTEAFIKRVSPTYAVITSSKGEPEDQQTVNTLTANGAITFLTRDGSITFTITKDSIDYLQWCSLD